MGGGVSLAIPIGQNNQKMLAEKYKVKHEAGMSDEDIEAELKASLPSIVLFDQIDCDHSGEVTKKELKRMLKSLPRKKPVEPEGGWPGGEQPKVRLRFDASTTPVYAAKACRRRATSSKKKPSAIYMRKRTTLTFLPSCAST